MTVTSPRLQVRIRKVPRTEAPPAQAAVLGGSPPTSDGRNRPKGNPSRCASGALSQGG
jgi:hypothetical protein